MEPKAKVLIVDDDPDVLSLMKQILNDAGFAADTADSGRGAIQKVEESRPTLMTLDLVMPDVDGWGVLAHLRRVPAPPPVVVVTGHPESVGPFSVMASVAAYVVKPFSPSGLVSTCQKVAEGRGKGWQDTDRRGEQRRLFVVEAKVVSPETGALASGHVVEVSPSGLRIDVDLAIEAGHTVDVSFLMPGNKEPIKARCAVRWRRGQTSGLELVHIEPAQAQQLRDLVRPLGKVLR
jgi:DNA-binding response OmpR family regulator